LVLSGLVVSVYVQSKQHANLAQIRFFCSEVTCFKQQKTIK